MTAIYLLTTEQDNGGFGLTPGSAHSTSVLSAHPTWNAARGAALFKANAYGCPIAREHWLRDGMTWKHHLLTSDEEEYVWLQITKLEVR